MYTVATSGGLITQPDPTDRIRYELVNATCGDQFFFHPGIAGGFLAQLYLATSETRWLDLAKRYMLFAETAPDHLFGLLRAGKVGWAASVLYRITGEKKYLDMAIQVGDSLVAQQNKDGSWPFGSEARHNDITAEMVVWLDEIHQAIEEARTSTTCFQLPLPVIGSKSQE